MVDGGNCSMLKDGTLFWSMLESGGGACMDFLLQGMNFGRLVADR
jgi:hypothetical protein